jgi:hypothetical protein
MHTRGFPFMIDVSGTRIDAGFRAPSTERPVLIALQLRDRGWNPCKVSFDPYAGAWVAFILGGMSANDLAEDSRPAAEPE